MTEWKKYTGAPEQIEEMRNAKHGFITDNGGGVRFMARTNEDHEREKPLLGVKKYLICNPHPYEREIQQWSVTGQPVYCRSIKNGGTGKCHKYFPPFAHPNEFEYRFTLFED